MSYESFNKLIAKEVQNTFVARNELFYNLPNQFEIHIINLISKTARSKIGIQRTRIKIFYGPRDN